MPTGKPWTWKNVDLPKNVQEAIGRVFQLGLFRTAHEQDPRNVEILMELGNLYTLAGDVRESLQIDLKLVAIQPDEPIFHYNLACSHSLLGDVDAAFCSLEQAIDSGYGNLEYIEEDADLENLRRDRRFEAILAKLRGAARQAPAARKKTR